MAEQSPDLPAPETPDNRSKWGARTGTLTAIALVEAYHLFKGSPIDLRRVAVDGLVGIVGRPIGVLAFNLPKKPARQQQNRSPRQEPESE